jgi:2,4-dienoyl-CoA reductase-like NADH-dependent reductase (Old Yellow Enzyme family)
LANTETNRYSRVLRKLKIGNLEIKNRIMMTGHTQLYGKDGTLSERHINYYQERAKGGAGLLILEQQAVHPAGRNYQAGCLACDERAIPWYKKLGEAVHKYDCKQLVQLFACGAQGDGTQYMDDWRPLWAASRIPSAVTEEMPIAMEQEHIDELIAHFVKSAVNVSKSGLDGIEIHAAHSQLLGEFLSPAFNKRDDKYGGDLENRCRLIVEIGEAIRKELGPAFVMGLRISFDEYLGEAGITSKQAEEQLAIFKSKNLFDFYDISAGGYHTLHIAVAPMGTMKDGFLAESAKKARKILGPEIPLFIVGRFLTLNHAEKILASGDVDMVAMTRAHMADAHLVNKSIENKENEVTHCIGANICISRLINNREVTCFQNPEMGREGNWGKGTLVPANDAQEISVIGGGPAGLRFAGTAALRGHSVTLFESESDLGGRINLLKKLPTRATWQRAIDNLVTRAEIAGVKIHTSSKIVESTMQGDISVFATGALWETKGYSPYRPERAAIPGHKFPIVTDIKTAVELALSSSEALGKNVVIVDETGEYLPLGLAELLASRKVFVEIISPRPFIGADTQRTLDMPYLMPRLKTLNVRLSAQHFVEEIFEDAISVYDIWGGAPERRSNISAVVLAMTQTPNDYLYHKAKEDYRVQRVGDIVAPRRIEAVIFEAEKCARDI